MLLVPLLLAGAQAPPSAEQILDRFVEVTGGKAAYVRMKTEVVQGVMEMKAAGIKGEMKSYRDAQGNTYTLVEIPGVGKVEEGTKAGVAWEKSAVMGPRLKDGEEKAVALRNAALLRDLEWKKYYTKAEVAGSDNVDGEPCWKVVLTPASGKGETRYYSQKTGYLLRLTMVLSSPMGEIPMSATTVDYRDAGGVKFPHRSVMTVGAQEMVMSVTSVKFNEPLPAAVFELPPDVKALAEKKPAPKK